MRGALVVTAAAAALALLGAGGARAQVFSPGELSKAHASLEGMRGCSKCHIEGSSHSDERCLECHDEINKRLEGGAGYHSSVKQQKCAECHLEHRGRNKSIIEWKPSRDEFNHRLTGWPLTGPHKEQKCKDCHELRRIEDAYVKNLVKEVGRETYLGVSTRCAACHFDEHRQQLGRSCDKCHTAEKFKDAPGFDHNKPKEGGFPLIGKHKDVKCANCHETLTDAKPPPDFPKPRAKTYLKVKNIEHASCVACHEDVHRGAFGSNCARCHTPKDWTSILEKGINAAFHDKYGFPLRGEHQSVACKSCHGPFGGEPVKYKGVKYGRCTDCHFDAHFGQMPIDEGSPRCEKCHTVNGFIPVLMDVKLHETTHFPLEGSHRTVACKQCHKPDQRLLQKVNPKDKSEAARRGRELKLSQARIRMPDVVTVVEGKAQQADCDLCHDDPHLGQFQKPAEPPDTRAGKKACVDCHTTKAFADTTFKHDNSRFPLTGKHTEATCASCHIPPAPKGDEVVATPYRLLPYACSSCHADAHVGQFVAAATKPRDCGECHSTTAFKPGTFEHNKSTAFPLEGKHEKAACDRCHPTLDVKGTKIARYRPLPAACTTCHDDQHKGAYDRFVPPKPAAAPAAPAVTPASPGPEVHCGECHKATGWSPAKFQHQLTGFELTGRHGTIRCGMCHGADPTKAVPMTCAGCHIDVHGQQFGLSCAACHSTDGFTAPGFNVDAHRMSNFPLTGRHAALPCDECHLEKRERAFTRAAVDCGICHQRDVAVANRVTTNHSRAPFSNGSCRDCHVAATFLPAQFPSHDQCFPITSGSHLAVGCRACHGDLGGTRFTGDCVGVPVICNTCHAHDEATEAERHQGVPGYEHKSEKCAACHHTPR